MRRFIWTHRRTGHVSDPVNIEFNANIRDVITAFRTIGWRCMNTRFAGDLYLKDGRVQELQITNGPWWRKRHHIRLWSKSIELIIGSAHYERFSLIGHKVLSFDKAIEEITSQFERLGNWIINDHILDPADIPVSLAHFNKIITLSKISVNRIFHN